MKYITLFFFSIFMVSNLYAQENVVGDNEIQEEAKEASGQVVNTLISPLKDFNLNKDDIPEILVKARENPYLMVENCENIKVELQELEFILKTRDEDSFAKKTVMKTLSNTVHDAVPYRGWIRKLSGAEKHQKIVAESFQAGLMRRSYLKGYGDAKNCNFE